MLVVVRLMPSIHSIGGEYMKDHILKYFPYNFALFYSYIPNSKNMYNSTEQY